jgi:hypothetical protein
MTNESYFDKSFTESNGGFTIQVDNASFVSAGVITISE